MAIGEFSVKSTDLPSTIEAAAARCAVYVPGSVGGSKDCLETPTKWAVLTYPYGRSAWRVFFCARHGGEVPGTKSLDEDTRKQVEERVRDHSAAMAGKSFQPVRPVREGRNSR